MGRPLAFTRMPTKQAPLVSVVMPTYNRPKFVRHAFEMFKAQTYPCKELILIDDGNIPAPIIEAPNVKTIRIDQHITLGEKHNIGTAKAQGEYIVHWDDDDYFSPGRLGIQIEPIALGQCDFTGILMDYILTVPDCRFLRWKRGFPRGGEPVNFAGHDGTMAYHRKWWDMGARYAPIMVGEKVEFIHAAQLLGAKVQPLGNRGNFVYIRHSKNSWDFPLHWLAEVKRPVFFPENELAFYRGAA